MGGAATRLPRPSAMRSVVVKLMRSAWPFIIGSSTGPRSMRHSLDAGGLARRGARRRDFRISSTRASIDPRRRAGCGSRSGWRRRRRRRLLVRGRRGRLLLRLRLLLLLLRLLRARGIEQSFDALALAALALPGFDGGD